MSNKRKNWLRRSGLIVGLAGVVEILFFFGIVKGEGEPSFTSLFPVIVVCVIPFLVCMLIAWKWPLAGGVLLIIIALYWEAASIVNPLRTQPILFSRFTIVLPLSLPLLATGILFLLSWKVGKR